MKKIISGIVFLIFANLAFAANDQIPKNRVITEISIYDGLAFVSFSPSFTNSQNCSSGGSTEISIDMTGETGKSIYSAALAAATSGKNVGFGITSCYENRPRIYRIDVAF